jgi:hypothetical protein
VLESGGEYRVLRRVEPFAGCSDQPTESAFISLILDTPLLDGPITGICFRRYVEETLVPTLKHGDTVVLDNLTAHKVSGSGATIGRQAPEPKDRTARTAIRTVRCIIPPP